MEVIIGYMFDLFDENRDGYLSPDEYKQVFDMIMRSYQQLQDSFEYLEELWVYLYESIYDQCPSGKLQFDKLWKDLFLE